MSKLEQSFRASEDQQHGQDVAAICVSGSKVYTTGEDGKVKVWTNELKFLHEFQAHDYAVLCLLVFGNKLLTGSVDATIRVWNLTSYDLIKTVTGHEESVRCLTASGTHVYSGDDKGEVLVWNAEGKVEFMYSMVEEVWGLHVEGHLIYTVRDRGLTITEVKGGQSKQSSVIRSLDGRAPLHVVDDRLFLMDTSGTVIQVFNTASKSFNLIGQLTGHEKIVNSLTSCGKTRLISGGWDEEVKLWDAENLSLLNSCKIPGYVTCMASDGNNFVYVGGFNGYIVKMKLS